MPLTAFTLSSTPYADSSAERIVVEAPPSNQDALKKVTRDELSGPGTIHDTISQMQDRMFVDVHGIADYIINTYYNASLKTLLAPNGWPRSKYSSEKAIYDPFPELVNDIWDKIVSELDNRNLREASALAELRMHHSGKDIDPIEDANKLSSTS